MSGSRSVLAFVLLCVMPLPAQVSAQPSSSSKVRHNAISAAKPLDNGAVNNGVYRNSPFGFSCKIPTAWVLRTDEMNTRDDDPADDAGKDARAKDPKPSRVLLAAFSRPPAAHGEDVNSSILIAAESTTAYPGLKDAAQYFDPLTEIAKAQGFTEDEDPYDYQVTGKTLPRADFQKDVGTRVMRQSTLVMLAHGYAISFTFIGGTEDEVEELIGGLSFAAAQKPAK